MGSTFFSSGSGVGKFASNLAPVDKYLRYVSPGASRQYKQGQEYQNRMNVDFGPTPFAGKQPTLADANAGYVQAARSAAPMVGMAPTVKIPQTPPRALMG